MTEKVKREVHIMQLREKSEIMDKDTAKRAVSRIAYEIVERNKGADELVMIGIQKRGVSLAKALVKRIEEIEGIRLPMGTLDRKSVV